MKVLTAPEGKYLTQASPLREEDRVFTNEIFLGIHDSEENYIEVDEEFKLNWEKEYIKLPEFPVENIEQLPE